jgi:hypothetical protein
MGQTPNQLVLTSPLIKDVNRCRWEGNWDLLSSLISLVYLSFIDLTLASLTSLTSLTSPTSHTSHITQIQFQSEDAVIFDYLFYDSIDKQARLSIQYKQARLIDSINQNKQDSISIQSIQTSKTRYWINQNKQTSKTRYQCNQNNQNKQDSLNQYNQYNQNKQDSHSRFFSWYDADKLSVGNLSISCHDFYRYLVERQVVDILLGDMLSTFYWTTSLRQVVDILLNDKWSTLYRTASFWQNHKDKLSIFSRHQNCHYIKIQVYEWWWLMWMMSRWVDGWVMVEWPFNLLTNTLALVLMK